MDASGQMQLPGVETAASGKDGSTLAAVAAAFDPARLTQARRLAGLTKTAVARELGVSAVAVGQWESGTHPPRPDHVGRLAAVLEVPPAFLAGGRPYARLEGSPRTSAACGGRQHTSGPGPSLSLSRSGNLCTPWRNGCNCRRSTCLASLLAKSP